MYIALAFHPPQPAVPDKAEGRYVTLRGRVEEKEYALRNPGEELYIRLTLEDAEMESKIPQEGAFVIHRDDKVLCLLEDEPGCSRSGRRKGQ